MSKIVKLLRRILAGNADRNIPFDDLRKLLLVIGFSERITGSHHIFTKEGVEEIINLQAIDGNKAKAYQVNQVRQLLIDYKFVDHILTNK